MLPFNFPYIPIITLPIIIDFPPLTIFSKNLIIKYIKFQKFLQYFKFLQFEVIYAFNYGFLFLLNAKYMLFDIFAIVFICFLIYLPAFPFCFAVILGFYPMLFLNNGRGIWSHPSSTLFHNFSTGFPQAKCWKSHSGEKSTFAFILKGSIMPFNGSTMHSN